MQFSFENIRRIFFRVPSSEKILLTKHLSMMIRAGMPVVSSLRIIRKQIKSKSFGRVLDNTIKDVENGQFLSVSLLPFKHVFGSLFINVIKIGEASGTLAENLDYLAGELRKAQQLRSKAISALIYPVVILIATLGVTGAIVFFVLPKILPIFSSLNVKLPLTTKILIAASQFLFAYYLWIIVGLIGFVILIMLLLRSKTFHYIFDRFLIMLPLVGRMMISYNTASFTRTLGLLLKSGVKIIEAITITADVITNHVYQREIGAIAEQVQKGKTLHGYFEQKPNLFPPIVSRMIEVGENTGKLDSNLFYLAEFYENEIDETTKNISSILEPILLIVMGLLVGFVAISIITPIYNVTQGLQQ